MNLYPEMDSKIVGLLRCMRSESNPEDQPFLYAAARIEELERQIAAACEAFRDSAIRACECNEDYFTTDAAVIYKLPIPGSEALAERIRAERLEEAKWWRNNPVDSNIHHSKDQWCTCENCQRFAELSTAQAK